MREKGFRCLARANRCETTLKQFDKNASFEVELLDQVINSSKDGLLRLERHLKNPPVFFDTIELTNARSRGSVYQRTLSQHFLSKKRKPRFAEQQEQGFSMANHTERTTLKERESI